MTATLHLRPYTNSSCTFHFSRHVCTWRHWAAPILMKIGRGKSKLFRREQLKWAHNFASECVRSGSTADKERWCSSTGKMTVVDRSSVETGRGITPSTFFPFVSAVIRRHFGTYSCNRRGVRPLSAWLCVSCNQCSSFGNCPYRGISSKNARVYTHTHTHTHTHTYIYIYIYIYIYTHTRARLSDHSTCRSTQPNFKKCFATFCTVLLTKICEHV